MKLLHCLCCGQVTSLRREQQICFCGASGGRYVDNVLAEYHGPARVIAMRNGELMSSLHAQHVPYEGPHYTWWVVCEGEHIRRMDSAAETMAALDRGRANLVIAEKRIGPTDADPSTPGHRQSRRRGR